MTTADALLYDIRANPDDDLPRLVYADWLDEHAGTVECPVCCGTGHTQIGQLANGRGGCNTCDGTGRVSNGKSERAEFIRVQCELARPYDVHADTYWRGQLDMPPDVARRVQLRQREWEMWFGERGVGGMIRRTLPTNEWGVKIDGLTDWGGTHPVAIVRRGFVAEVRAPLAALVGGECECVREWEWNRTPTVLPGGCSTCNGTGTTPGVLRRVAAENPVVKVECSDREPMEVWDGSFAWFAVRPGPQESNELPEDVFALLTGQSRSITDNDLASKTYPTREAAVAALSRALIAWAKSPPATLPANTTPGEGRAQTTEAPRATNARRP